MQSRRRLKEAALAMTRATILVSASIPFMLMMTACGGTEPMQTTPNAAAPQLTAVSPRPTATPTAAQMADDASQRQFVDRLRSTGLSVETGDSVAQSFLRVSGTILHLSGGSLRQPAAIQSYAYMDPAIAADDVRRVSPDGGGARWTNPDGTGQGVAISWIAPPHFFHRDRLLALYVGKDTDVIALLTDLLGPQVAGR